MARLSLEEFRNTNKYPLIVVLEDVRSGLNVGSVFRSADSFRIEKIYLTGYTACPPHREVLKTALGATESMDWEQRADAADLCLSLKALGYLVVASEQTPNSLDIRSFQPELKEKKGLVVVFGNEVQGVSKEVLSVCDLAIEIVQQGTKHSLNVAVCAGIVLYDLTHKLDRLIDL